MILDFFTVHPLVQAVLIICLAAGGLVPFAIKQARRAKKEEREWNLNYSEQQHNFRLEERGLLIEHDKVKRDS